jgi:AraC-like DNA-binding protein
MNIDARTPTKALSPFIKTFLIIESQDERINKVMPDTSLVMAFRFKGSVSYLTNGTKKDLSPFVVSGLRKSGRHIHYSKDAGNILVIFKEAGANAFLTEPLHELAEDSISLDNFFGFQNLSSLEDHLAEAMNNTQRINVIEQFLLSKLYYRKPDALILAALERIRLANGIIKIKDLADTLCISQDAFEKRFRRTVGISPKQFSYIVRMRYIISLGVKKQTLTETAFHAGYYDQPHFNKDFKLFTGQSPSEFLKAPVFW